MAIRWITAIGAMATLLAVGGASLWYRHSRGVDDIPPPARTVQAQPPLARWMRAAPNPLVLDPPVMSNRRREAEVSAGGHLVQLVANRQKFTLYVPPGAIALNADITMTAISELPGLPFADPAMHAIRIENLPPALHKPVTLTIEPAPQAPGDAPVNAAAFAMDGTSREVHLYPFAQSEQAVRNRRQARYQMQLGRDGVYGIAHATGDELDAAFARTPTDYLSRLEMMVARAMRAPQPVPTASHWSRWSPVSTAHAQSADDQKQLDPFELDAAKALREYHEQRLMPRLDELGRGCSEKDRDFFMAFTDEANRWLKSAELIGFIRMDPDETPLDPATNPYAYHAEAERRAYFAQLEKEFGAKADALKQGLLGGTRRMFDSVKTCCRKRPAQWMPHYMVGMQRGAELGGYASTLAADGLGDAQACGCAVDAVHEGKGWTGSIRQTDSYSGEAKSVTPRSRRTTTTTHRYTVNVALMGAEKGSALGLATASGERERTTRRVDTDWACAVDEAGGSTRLGGGAGTTLEAVDISLRDDGTYLINYPLPLARGLEFSRNYYLRAGCKNRFNDDSKDRVSVRAAAVAAVYHKPIRGQTDNATVLAGSMTVQIPDTHLQRNRQATVEWNLRACAVN